MAWSGLELVGVTWSGLEWVGVAWSGLEWVGVAWNGLEWVGAQFDEARLDDMLNFLKRELDAKERSLSVGATFPDKRKQSFDKCFQIRLYLIKALTQTIEKKEKHVSFVAHLITNLINV